MKKVLISLGLLALLSACAIRSPIETGRGDVTVSPAIGIIYERTYGRLPNKGYFLISADGTHSAYTHCDEVVSRCYVDVVVEAVQRNCARRAGDPCYILAKGDDIVWDGTVKFEPIPVAEDWELSPPPDIIIGTAAVEPSAPLPGAMAAPVSPVVEAPTPPTDALPTYAEFEACSLALAALDEASAFWADQAERDAALELMRFQNFTAASCMQVRADAAANYEVRPELFAQLPDQILCRVAFVADGTPSVDQQVAKYVDESNRRNLTADDCKAALG